VAATVALATPRVEAAVPAARLSAHLAAEPRQAVSDSVDPRLAYSSDLGALPGDTVVQGVSLNFKPDARQQAALDALLLAQRTPGSSWYHHWLTPEQYADRFGMSRADLQRVTGWLQQQGLTVRSIARGRNRISFDGSVARIEHAFGTELHRYRYKGQTHFANASALQLPSSLAVTLAGVRNLSDFRPHPHLLRSDPRPSFTSTVSGSHYLAPNDVATIYDIAPLYTAGYTGSGHTLAVVGQTAINTSDIAAFRAAAGLPASTPTLKLVPSSGSSTVVDADLGEASLDVEWSGAMARNAGVIYVYTGNATNYNVLDAL
jgi:subtilase family serine protease